MNVQDETLHLCQHILGAFATLRSGPIDVLVWHFDVACFAVYAAANLLAFAMQKKMQDDQLTFGR